MIFNEHSDLKGKHAFLSASTYHWTNYDIDKLDVRYRTALAAQKGTQLHEFAQQAISLGIKLPRNTQTLNAYINDAIGFRMIPEQVLYYSPNCFGTADAIRYDHKKHFLRIHDLKTGVTKVSFRQLEVYKAIFCLEYGFKPQELDTELRIYQNDEIMIHIPEAETVQAIMNKIVDFDRHILEIQKEVLS